MAMLRSTSRRGNDGEKKRGVTRAAAGPALAKPAPMKPAALRPARAQRPVPIANGRITRTLALDFGGPIRLELDASQAHSPRGPKMRGFERGFEDDESAPPFSSNHGGPEHDESEHEAVEPDREEEDEPPAPTVMAEDDEELRRDLQAVRSNAKEPPPSAPAPRPAAVRRSTGAPGVHAIFDSMNMGLATTFDAGTFDLSRRFDELDRVIEQDDRRARESASRAVATSVQSARARAFDADEHIEALEDLALIRDAIRAREEAEQSAGGGEGSARSLDQENAGEQR